MKKVSKTHYFKPIKVVRDLIHGYINLTAFEIELIDTLEFQRLKDIRQLTCQHVYPSARHTRFEHSLGVLELTKQAIKYLNQNGCITPKGEKTHIINDQLLFNATIAALLHDIGHCPFSHMGESEFDSEEVRKNLCESIREHESLTACEDLINKIGTPKAKGIGSIHEQLSCITILETYTEILEELNIEPKDDSDNCEISVDFELVIRSILGIEYTISNDDSYFEKKTKNIIVNLINSKIFDMDKLDYVMRDSFFTGLSTAAIDTKRLFRNMFFDENYELVFTSRAIPVLQNMIDSRDSLYMYVYNHHAVIFSDFINTYISRRLSHNTSIFLDIVYPEKSKEEIKEIEYYDCNIVPLGLIPKPYLFSVDSIIGLKRSDSDWISLLNILDINAYNSEDIIKKSLENELIEYSGNNDIIKDNEEKINALSCKIKIAFNLIRNYKTRNFIKPWWKTVFEFKEFIKFNFRDDNIKENLCKYICSNEEAGLYSSEFRSQIAKHVIYITQQIQNRNDNLLEPLQIGDFFIIQRSNRFLSLDTIEKLKIALKVSEIINASGIVENESQQYYFKDLTSLVPQKDYSSIYLKEGFYIFSKPIRNLPLNEKKKLKKHYKLIEDIFTYVATELVRKWENEFIPLFNKNLSDEEIEKNEKQSMEEILKKFESEYM